MNFIPNTERDRNDMLKAVGISNIKKLFDDLPKEILVKNLKIPKGLSEIEIKTLLRKISEKNNTRFSYFLGAGAYKHFIPSVVNHIISRSEFYTAYTPYQPEISQGILQAIYEYQTMVCELTGMDAANASMYDGASALAESCIMAANITKRNEILISKTIHPEYRQVVKTYCDAHDFELVEIDFEDGVTSTNQLKEKIAEKTAAVLIQNPNFFGCIEDLEEIGRITHANNALLNVCVVEPTSLGILKSPGEIGADIVVGEGQSFGNAVNFGGPYLGIMSTKDRHARQMPGRLAGATVDAHGNRGYILTLQAREKHIRREKASSNICSNEALCALAAAAHLACLGKNGLRKLSELCLQKAHYLADELGKAGCKIILNRPFYNEFVIKVSDAKKINEELLKSNIIGGLELSNYYPEFENCLLLCVTELNTREGLDKLVEVVKECN